MALDTKQKRGSAVLPSFSGRPWLTEPTGTVDATARLSLLGFEAGGAEAPGGDPPSNDDPAYIVYACFRDRAIALTPGNWTGDDSLSYQWVRSNDGAGTGAVNISGATSASYTPTSDDEGKYLSVDETATNVDGSTTQRSNYRFCYVRAALPEATALARTLDDLSGYDGHELFTESIPDTSSAVPDPLTWKNEAPQNGKYFGWSAAAVDTSTRNRDNNSGCVKLSENWGAVANHVPGDTTGYTFVKADGSEVTVGSDAYVQIGSVGLSDFDLRLIHFDDPVSDADIPPIALPLPSMFNALAGEYCLAIERGRHLNRLLIDAGCNSGDFDTLWAPTTADVLEGGDSGKQVFLFVDGEPVLVATNIYTTLTGPNPAHWLREIQDVLATTGDELTLVRFESAGISGGGIGGNIGMNIMRSNPDDEEL